MSSFFKPFAASSEPSSSGKGAGSKVLSLTLALGLSATVGPLVSPLPAATAAPITATAAATPQATGAAEADTDDNNPEKVALKVTSGTLNISRGGLISVTTSPLSEEFHKKYAFHEFSLVKRGSVYVHAGHHNFVPFSQYGTTLRYMEEKGGHIQRNPDGSVTFTLPVPAQVVEAPEGTQFDVYLTYYPVADGEPDSLIWDARRLTTRTPIDVVQDPEPTETTYRFSQPAIEDPSKETTLVIEGDHILSESVIGGPYGPAVLTLYEADPSTGKPIGSPVLSKEIQYTKCDEYCSTFLNHHFSTDLTIPAGTLKAGKSYVIGFYGGSLPYPDMEEYPGQLLTDIAQFIPVGAQNPAPPAAKPTMDLSVATLNPYAEKNTVEVALTNLPTLSEGSYRLVMHPIDDHGRSVSDPILEQEIPAERIQQGSVRETLEVPGERLTSEVAYRVSLVKVTPAHEGSPESVQEVVFDDLEVTLNHKVEQQSALDWAQQRGILPRFTDSNSDLSRRDVTVALYRLAGSPRVELPESSPYPDLKPTDRDYSAIIWSRQHSITSGWSDGKFHADAPISPRSTLAFLYRYRHGGSQAHPSLPVSPSLPTSPFLLTVGTLNKGQGLAISKHWDHRIDSKSAFWREARWAVQQRIWGYINPKGGVYESFEGPYMTPGDLALMLYRLEHGGSRLN